MTDSISSRIAIKTCPLERFVLEAQEKLKTPENEELDNLDGVMLNCKLFKLLKSELITCDPSWVLTPVFLKHSDSLAIMRDFRSIEPSSKLTPFCWPVVFESLEEMCHAKTRSLVLKFFADPPTGRYFSKIKMAEKPFEEGPERKIVSFSSAETSPGYCFDLTRYTNDIQREMRNHYNEVTSNCAAQHREILKQLIKGFLISRKGKKQAKCLDFDHWRPHAQWAVISLLSVKKAVIQKMGIKEKTWNAEILERSYHGQKTHIVSFASIVEKVPHEMSTRMRQHVLRMTNILESFVKGLERKRSGQTPIDYEKYGVFSRVAELGWAFPALILDSRKIKKLIQVYEETLPFHPQERIETRWVLVYEEFGGNSSIMRREVFGSTTYSHPSQPPVRFPTRSAVALDLCYTPFQEDSNTNVELFERLMNIFEAIREKKVHADYYPHKYREPHGVFIHSTPLTLLEIVKKETASQKIWSAVCKVHAAEKPFLATVPFARLPLMNGASLLDKSKKKTVFTFADSKLFCTKAPWKNTLRKLDKLEINGAFLRSGKIEKIDRPRRRIEPFAINYPLSDSRFKLNASEFPPLPIRKII